MARNLQTVAFDADDTLWHNERFFLMSQARFVELLADHAETQDLEARLLAAEEKNLGHYGFGVKGFVLSMIETAIEVTEGAVPTSVISELLVVGQELLAHPMELLPHAQQAVEAAADGHHVVLITKGDLLHQERKLAQSGLGELFHGVEIVSDKTRTVYERIFDATPGGIDKAMMIGNSMKSDVRPAVEAGAWGVFVPHEHEWAFEKAEAPQSARYHALDDLAALPGLLRDIG